MTARTNFLPAIEIATADGGAPEWVQLTPSGPGILAATDGRKHRLSRPEQVVAAFNSYGLPLPIDVEHATHKRGDQGLDAPAYGWIREIEARDGALWARVEWTAQGAEWVTSKAYKFLSIGYAVEKASGEIVRLLSAGLTNVPGFQMPELAKSDPTTHEETTMDDAVLEALGLKPGASAADAVAKIKDLQSEVHTAKSATPDPELWVAKAQLDAANARITEFEEAETARKDEAFVAAVDAGIAEGKIAPAAKDAFVAVARAQGLETFGETLKAMPKVASGPEVLDRKAATETAKGAHGLSADELAVAKNLGMSADDFAAAKSEQET